MYSVKNLEEMITKFANGEVDVKSYKGFSGTYGTYAQRGGKSHMLRLRFAGGEITPEHMSFLATIVKKYDIKLIHSTTCQTIQLHNLKPNEVVEIISEAPKAGIFTKGGGGDHPRNVMCSPLSGVEKGEYFDVMPYAKAAAEYLMSTDDDNKMPRKLKVAFSSYDKNEVHATFRDLGFVARKDGLFDVYSAGGLGNGPKLGLLTAKAVNPDDVLTYIRAMVLMFTEYGNYTNRMRARTRFMRDELGDEKYIEEFNKNLKKAYEENLPKIKTEISPKKVGEKGVFETDRVKEQNTEGLYSVYYHPTGSNIPPDTIVKLADAMKKFDLNMRIIPNGGFYIINCKGSAVDDILEITKESGTMPIECSTACIGNSICQVGLQNSQQLLKDIISEVKKAGISANALPSVHISGCTSSCGSHQTNIIGFQGRIKKDSEGVSHPAFAMFMGGNSEFSSEKLGENKAVIFASDIPKMLVEIGRLADKYGKTFAELYASSYGELNAVIDKYN